MLGAIEDLKTISHSDHTPLNVELQAHTPVTIKQQVSTTTNEPKQLRKTYEIDEDIMWQRMELEMIEAATKTGLIMVDEHRSTFTSNTRARH